ncbi:hypothetical protein TGAM01_v201599 [Trichoderma gamsii]|uniref:Uncharacterized protein n=1 Tax=Trichoderma gamsii TaxID=398673 RepID=A0A2P4ZYJ2_9HYPO|nr:hypothetical protein TGAM01_v201599 [Trichoderma gamsii]PON29350.1 hypothetical protein TGAM01_v201599 [Trichoderma gamsii]
MPSRRCTNAVKPSTSGMATTHRPLAARSQNCCV